MSDDYDQGAGPPVLLARTKGSSAIGRVVHVRVHGLRARSANLLLRFLDARGLKRTRTLTPAANCPDSGRQTWGAASDGVPRTGTAPN